MARVPSTRHRVSWPAFVRLIAPNCLAASEVRNGQRYIYATDGHSQLVQIIVSGDGTPVGVPTNVTQEIIDARTAYGYFEFQKPYGARTYSDLTVLEDDGRHFVYGSNGGDLILFIGDIATGTWQASNLTQDTLSIYGDPDANGLRPITTSDGTSVTQARTPANEAFGSPTGYRLSNGDRHIFQITAQGEVVEYYIQFDVNNSTRDWPRFQSQNVNLRTGFDPTELALANSVSGTTSSGAVVSALNLGTGATFQTTALHAGNYNLPLPEGWYTLTSQSNGSTTIETPVVVDANTTVDFSTSSFDNLDDLVITDNLAAYVAESGADSMQVKRYSDWIPNVLNFGTGDLNGDGLEDIVGHDAKGTIYVGLATGQSSYSVKIFGSLSSSIDWSNFTVADFDGDGKDDVIVRADSDGSWWALKSTGNEFTYRQIAKYAPQFNWRFVTGDFDGDGRQDIAGLAGTNGAWWVGYSNGATAQPTNRGSWNASNDWSDFVVGDFNGDGHDEVAARANNSTWWVADFSDSFVTALWAGWSGSNWESFTVGDFDDDGDDDIVARATTTGDWWMAVSSRSSFSHARWGNWPTYTNWRDVEEGDFNGDGRSDLIGRADNGEWWILESTDSRFSGRFGANVGPFVADSASGSFGSTEPSLALQYTDDLLDSVPFPVLDAVLADFDGNGAVDFVDFLVLSSNFGAEEASKEEGDANGDGVVDFADFLLLSNNFG